LILLKSFQQITERCQDHKVEHDGKLYNGKMKMANF
jgi:hypothetical protein